MKDRVERIGDDPSRKELNDKLVEQWLSNLLLDEHREVYENMSKDEKLIVLFALKYPANVLTD